MTYARGMFASSLSWRPLRRALAGVVLGSSIAVLALAVAIDRFGLHEGAREADVIVVLGARVRSDGSASPALRARTEKAVDLYRRGIAKVLLFSGGAGEEGRAEAAVAKAIAVGLGVPESACWIEDRSHSTLENARFSAEILRDRGVHRVVVVSDPYHLLRARQCFRQQGVDVNMSPALRSERHMRLSTRIRWTLREALALLARPSLMASLLD